MDILFIDVKIRGAQFWFMALNCTIVGWYHTMFICQPNTMRTSTLRFATTFVQSSICSSMFTKDMIVQLLRSHATTTMPPKGMWSKPMKLKNISTITMYLHWKQCGAPSSLICMSGFLPLSVCNTICPNQQMVLFDDDVQEWQQVSHFQNNAIELVQNKPRIKRCTKPYVINSLNNGCGIGS